MDKFIDQIADYIKAQDFELENLVILLPSQRAKKYLQKALFNVYQKPIFSPEILTMDAWIRSHALPVIDPTRALFELYQIHKETNPKEDKGLDEFIQWGRTLLNDFDEVDRYLVKSKEIFKNLADIKEIENWSFDSVGLTPAQQRFMAFWDSLPGYYKAFNKRLDEMGVTYMGKAYKTVAENIDKAFEKNKKYRFIFAGFNALSKAEMSIMNQLYRMGRASIFVDVDNYYLNDPIHEAGTFHRRLMDELQVKKLDFTQNNLLTDAKNITLINCTQSTGQAKVAATLLKEKVKPSELSETLVLLADERLAIPVIKNIPNTVEKANITIGLPLKNTAVRSWVDLLFNVQENYAQFRTKSIYHKELIRFIKHPFILGCIGEEEQVALRKLEENILEKNWLFISLNSLSISPLFDQLIKACFSPWETPFSAVLPLLRKVHQGLYKQLDKEKNSIDRALIYHLDTSLAKLENILLDYQPEISLQTFKSLFNQHWINEKVAYYGNPTDGLQIIGLLESRLLDFNNLIVVGLNEGAMPPTNPLQSLIPMDLRKHFKMPVPRDKQGLFAHHFYRLLHHAKNCWITYSTSERGNGVEEPSRYIHQIKLELRRVNKKINFKELFYTVTDAEQKSTPVVVEKTPALIQRLDEYFEKGTSVSALQTFLRCPLDFYYRYVLGFHEDQAVEEEIEASTFGSFIHNTLEELYEPYALYKNGEKQYEDKKPPLLNETAVEQMKRQFPELLKSKFEAHYKWNKAEAFYGKNYLSLEVAEQLVEKYLSNEQKQMKAAVGHRIIHSVEQQFLTEKTYSINGEQKKVRFKGIIDRIDQEEEGNHVLDYKTGTCDTKKVRITSTQATTDKEFKAHLLYNLKKQRYVFQLLMYNQLYYDSFGAYPDQAGIISLVNLKNSPFYLDNGLVEDKVELMRLFEDVLGDIIRSIYDVSEIIQHDLSSEYCLYCQ